MKEVLVVSGQLSEGLLVVVVLIGILSPGTGVDAEPG